MNTSGWRAITNSATGCVHAPPRCSRRPSATAPACSISRAWPWAASKTRTEFDRVELTNLWTFERRDGVTDTFGAEFSVSQAEYDYARSATYDPAVAAAFARPPTNDLVFAVRPKVFTYALHAAERRQWKSFEAELGLRFDGEHYNLGGDHTQLSPRLNLRYDVNDRLRVYTSIGRFSQAQHVEEWRVEEAQATADSAQVSIHTILGVTFEPSTATRWGVEAYSKRWTSIAPYLDSQLDPLSLTPDLQPDRTRIAPDESEAAGLELSARTRILRSPDCLEHFELGARRRRHRRCRHRCAAGTSRWH